MIRRLIAAAVLGLSCLVPPAWAAPERVHVVAEGQTLGKIARRYGVSIEALCTANRIARRDPLKIGQKLLIPEHDDPTGARAARVAAPSPRAADGRAKASPGPPPGGPPQVHEVAEGQSLERIARRYGTSVDALCAANRLDRDAVLSIGQKLLVPVDGGDGRAQTPRSVEEAPETHTPREPDGLQVLDAPGAPPAYFYEPSGSGRLSQRPVIVYLHGRGGDARADCRRWARVARPRGWLLCPSGHEDRGGGARGWGNDWANARHSIKRALAALRTRYGRRVQLYGNTLIGFSEGAFVAMNVGVREPRVFNRWLILAANDSYWGLAGHEALKQARRTVRRVYLITGAEDEVVDGSRAALAELQRAGVPVRFVTPGDMGHEVSLASRPHMYVSALLWLERG